MQNLGKVTQWLRMEFSFLPKVYVLGIHPTSPTTSALTLDLDFLPQGFNTAAHSG